MALQEATPSDEEIDEGLSDANWKLRCLAARACGAHGGRDCLGQVQRLVDGDPQQEVHTCAIEALALGCVSGGREALAIIAKAKPADRTVAEAVSNCLSGDAVLSIVDASTGESAQSRVEANRPWEAKLLLPSELLAPLKDGTTKWLLWLERVAALPGPGREAKAKLAEARATQAEAKQRAIERVAQEQRDRKQREADAEEARASAERLLAEGDGDGALEKVKQAEKLGLVVHELRIRAQARVDAQTQEREAAWAALWGPFSEWKRRPRNRVVIATIKRLLLQEATRRKLSQEHEEEKQANDEKASDPEIFSDPIFPQTTGAFMYVKILDRSNSEALFEATDGLFVLRLSPGDSFNAYQGQNVSMTMHSRGETMLMTTGRRLPVFWSGYSPARTRRIGGFTPDRRKENQLASQLKALDAAIVRERKAALKPMPDSNGHYLVASPSMVRVTFFLDENSTDRIIVEDLGAHRSVYCIGSGACSGADERVDSDDVIAAR